MLGFHVTRNPPEFQLRQPTFTDEEVSFEVWKAIPGYEGHYEASTLGRIKSLKNYHGWLPGRILHVSFEKGGYHKVTLSMHSKGRTWKVHQLIALTFIGPCPRGHEVNHKDTCNTNNRESNLEYRTHKGNMEHAAANGLTARGDRHGLRKWKNAAARGDDHGLRKHPERVSRGDDHYSRKHPEKVLRGEKNGNATLTNAQWEDVCAEYLAGGWSYKRLGRKHNVSGQSICNHVRARASSPK